MTNRHAGARTVQQVLDQAPSLAQLQQQLRASKECLAAILPLIPVPMHSVVHAGPFEQHEASDGSMRNTWILLADNAAAATKLRQMQPLFLQYLDKAGLRIPAIKVQIMPHTAPL